jgi:Tetratricopeptide repeat
MTHNLSQSSWQPCRYGVKIEGVGAEVSPADDIGNLASTFWNQGRWKEAEELDERVMERSLKVLRQEHTDTLTSMNNIARSLSEQGKAEEIYRRLRWQGRRSQDVAAKQITNAKQLKFGLAIT